MNKEMRRICEKKGYEKNYPRRIDSNLLLRKVREFNGLLSEFHVASRSNDYQTEMDMLIDNVYMILDILAMMGIQPDGMLDAFIKNCELDTIDNSELRILIKRELNMMKNYRYTYSGDCDILESYAKMKKAFDDKKIPYNKGEISLNSEDTKAYIFRGCANFVTGLPNSLDLEDDAYYLINMLYYDLYTIAKMGIAPEVLKERIDEKIDGNTKKH